MKKTVIALAAALTLSSGVALAQGGPSPYRYESTQPHPRFTQAERDASFDPFAWVQRLFDGSDKPELATTAPHPGAGTVDRPVHG